MNLTAVDTYLSKTFFRLSIGLLLTFAITFAVWAPCLKNDFVDWDDLNMIVHNPRFEPPTWANTGWYWTHPAWNLYQPMTTTLWAALAYAGWQQRTDQFGGHLNPAVFHFAGVLLHTLVTVLLFSILRRLFRSEMAAMAGALMFAVHPMQVEPVVFAGVLNVPLAGFFSLLAIVQYLAVTDPSVSQTFSIKAIRWTIGSLALLLALLSRPSAVVVPPIALMLDWAIGRRSLRKSAKSILPWVLVLLPCVLWTRAIQHGHDLAVRPFGARCWIALDSINFYLRKIAWPMHLGIDYGRSPDFVFAHGMGCLSLIAPCVLVIVAALCFRRLPAISAAIVVFIVGLLPNSGLLPFDYQLISTVSDRYAYFAMVAVALLCTAAIKKIPVSIIPVTFVIVCLIVRVEQQIPNWANGETMFRQALSVNPDSWMSDMNLASVIADRSPDEATYLCERSIALRPDRADPWNTIGTIRYARHDIAGAIQAFTHACKLAPLNEAFRSNLAHAKNIRPIPD